MLSLFLVDGRIFFVQEMKFPYKKIFHTQKKCGEIRINNQSYFYGTENYYRSSHS